MSIRTIGQSPRSLIERRKSLEVVEAHLVELTKRGYELARLNAVDSQCEGLVLRIDRQLSKLEVLIQRVRSTYDRLESREIQNGD